LMSESDTRDKAMTEPAETILVTVGRLA
jgi:hypothetical protein